MERKKNPFWFWLINGLIALVILVFIIQNWGVVTFTFLGLKLEGYGFLVFLIIFLLGFFSGWLWSYYRGQQQKRQANMEQQTHKLED